MKKIKLIGRIIYWTAVVALLLGAGFAAVSALNLPGNYKIMSVLSGSMEPTIKTGSIVVIKPEVKYQKGDVISFRDPLNLKTTVTHRINSINLQEGSYSTKGDANKTPDLSEVRRGNILGKVTLTVPYLGYFVEFMKSKNGVIVIILIAALIIYNELANAKRELFRLLAERKKRKLNIEEKIEEKIDEKIIKAEKKIGKVFKKKK